MDLTDEELAALVTALADPAYATGARRFPSTLDFDDVAEVAELVQRRLDRALATRADAARRQRFRIACKRGCNACCEEPIVVYLPEAAAVTRFLARPGNAEVRRKFLAAHPAWRAAHGDGLERLAALASDDDARAEYEAAHRKAWRRGVLCAFNHDGDCAIYPVRPLVCREGHALDTADHCRADSPIPARRLTAGPLERELQTDHLVLRAAHNAATDQSSTLEALCESVARLLAAAGLT